MLQVVVSIISTTDNWQEAFLVTYTDVVETVDEAVLNHDTEVQSMIAGVKTDMQTYTNEAVATHDVELKTYVDELFSSIVNGNEVAY